MASARAEADELGCWLAAEAERRFIVLIAAQARAEVYARADAIDASAALAELLGEPDCRPVAAAPLEAIAVLPSLDAARALASRAHPTLRSAEARVRGARA